MTGLLYFMLWVGIIFLMRRFGCGAHMMSRGRGKTKYGKGVPDGRSTKSLRWTPPGNDVDPVCGKTVSTETAKSSVHDGYIFYFCSRDCREHFEAAPEQYLANDEIKHPPTQSENEHA